MNVEHLLNQLEKEEKKLMIELGYKVPEFGINVTPSMNIESHSEKDCCLIHSLLHLFYHTGNKQLSKTDIEQLHSKVITKINHKEFDRLDRQNENN